MDYTIAEVQVLRDTIEKQEVELIKLRHGIATLYQQMAAYKEGSIYYEIDPDNLDIDILEDESNAKSIESN